MSSSSPSPSSSSLCSRRPRHLRDSFILGSSGLAGLFEEVKIEDSIVVVETAYERFKIRSIDTAPHYGCGLSEEVLGLAMQRLGIVGSSSGDDMKIYTKVGRVILPLHHSNVDPAKFEIEHSNIPYSASCAFKFPQDKVDVYSSRTPVLDYSYDGVNRSFDDSLKRLQTSKIFGLRLHDYDISEAHTALAGSVGLKALLDLRHSGVIDDVGVGVNSAKAARQLIEMSATFENEATYRSPIIDSIMLANSWNLLDHSLEADAVLKLCRSKGTKVHLGGVFASGVLVGGNTYRYVAVDVDSPICLKVKQWKALCDQFNIELPVAAIGFALLYDEVDAISIGVKSVLELEQVASWFAESSLIPSMFWKQAKEAGLLAPHIVVPLP